LIVLRRIEPQRNMNRFYALSLQPDLFGTFSVVKEWGRIGQPRTVRQEVYVDETAARAALVLRKQKKINRGYCPSRADRSWLPCLLPAAFLVHD
jgi:predicted DNA-binding WGR domain protein